MGDIDADREVLEVVKKMIQNDWKRDLPFILLDILQIFPVFGGRVMMKNYWWIFNNALSWCMMALSLKGYSEVQKRMEELKTIEDNTGSIQNNADDIVGLRKLVSDMKEQVLKVL